MESGGLVLYSGCLRIELNYFFYNGGPYQIVVGLAPDAVERQHSRSPRVTQLFEGKNVLLKLMVKL